MDYSKVGEVLLQLRKEKKMTQKQIADAMCISDKTVSKWERGLGCPDVSLLGALSQIFEVNIEKVLSGDLEQNNIDGGNMKRIKFYVCPHCKNVMTSTGDAQLSCCGRKLAPLVPNEDIKKMEEHTMHIEEIENDYYVTFPHEMKKEHFISFVAYVAMDRVLLIKLYPEQSPAVRFPQMSGGKFYAFCNVHGLWKK